MRMTISGSLQNLVGELFNGLWWQWTANLPHVLLEIVFAILENEVEVVLLIYHFLKPING